MTTHSSELLPVEKLRTVSQHILDLAKKQGASAAEVAISSDIGLSVQTRLKEVETLEYHRDKGVGITVYFGKKKGSTSLSTLEENELAAAVAAACHIAKYTCEDDCAGLPDKQHLAETYPDLKLYYPRHISTEQAI